MSDTFIQFTPSMRATVLAALEKRRVEARAQAKGGSVTAELIWGRIAFDCDMVFTYICDTRPVHRVMQAGDL